MTWKQQRYLLEVPLRTVDVRFGGSGRHIDIYSLMIRVDFTVY